MSFRLSAPAGALLLALLAGAAPLSAVQPPVPATPPDYVVDLAGVVEDGAKSRLNSLLRELEQRTTAQVVVLTLRSLEGESLEAFSIDLAHKRWKLGQRGRDNGVLITLALQEKRYRFEIGYGLEAILPDSVVGSVGRELLVPAFRASDYGGGLAAAAGELAARIATASGVELSGVPAGSRGQIPARSNPRPNPLAIGFGVLLALVFLWMLIFHPRLLILMLLASRGGGSRGSWGGGGGGFGGGGGGGFGGGGASGSW